MQIPDEFGRPIAILHIRYWKNPVIRRTSHISTVTLVDLDACNTVNPIMEPPMRHSMILTILLATFSASPVHSLEIGPSDDLESAVAELNPGEELILRGGTYLFDENITLRANGTESEPIIIRAKDGQEPLLTQATNQQNVVEINGSSHLKIRGIRFTGGSHGIRLISSSYITIEDCEIFETGDVAISANSGGTYQGLKILRNNIHHTNGTGEGMYLGCNNDNCRIANSLIEGNYVHHTNRSTVSQGDGIEIKEGSYGNIIRDNVIHDTNYPGILVYSTAGNGPANVIERNVIWNVNDNTVQMAADAIFRNNIVLGNVAMQNHQSGSPSNIEFVHNTIVSSGNALVVRDVSGRVLIANNAIYAIGSAIQLISGDIQQVEVSGNIGDGGTSGVSGGFTEGNGISNDFVEGNYSGRPPIDVFPAVDGALIEAGSADHVVLDDFNGTPRSGTVDAGAYRFQEGPNPGWQIAEGFKSLSVATTPNPPEDLRTE